MNKFKMDPKGFRTNFAQLKDWLDTLHFDIETMRMYQEAYFSTIKITAQSAHVLAAILFAVFALLDIVLLPDEHQSLWVIRFGIVIPGILISIYAINRLRSYQGIEFLVSINIVLFGSGIIFMMILNENAGNSYYWVGLMLIINFAFSLSGVRFKFVLVSLTILLSVYFVSCLFWIEMDFPVFFSSLLFLVSESLIGMTGCFLVEVYKKRNFLQTRILDQKSAELELLYNKYQKLSLLDELTQIPNRRHFEKTLLRHLNIRDRRKESLCLLIIDVDHFKRFNDSYGHQAGDICLKRIAQIMSETLCRPDDFISRYGGEEFCAILPDTNLEGAIHIAERLRKNTEETLIKLDEIDNELNVTISIGIAMVTDEMSSGIDMLFNKADKALYLAKRSGRNRCEIYAELKEVGDN